MNSDRSIWASLPVPTLLIDGEDRIVDANPAAEGFFNASAKAIHNQPLWDMLAVDHPLVPAFERARVSATPLFVNDVDVGTGQRAPLQCALQIAPLVGTADHM